MRDKNAFTLAEVLITLGIIGVVASMTLPTLITNNRNRELESGLKVAYSTIEQGLRKMQAENGYPPTAEYYPTTGDFYPEYKKQFNKIYDCGFRNPNEDICMSRANNQGGQDGYVDLTYKTFNGKTLATDGFDDGQFVLPNGMLILIENDYIGNGTYGLGISVDINGKKKSPNRYGQDLFTFQIMSDGKLLPMGAPGTAYTDEATYCSATSSNKINGAGCTYKALTDKDYWKNLPK